MKNNRKTLIFLLIFVLIAAGIAVYYFSPKTFLKNVDPAEVSRISVFDGNTGEGFDIKDPEDVRFIVETIQNIPMKRNDLSLGYMGFGLKLSFVDENDRDVVPLFYLNSDDTIRKDPFFYRCDGGLCYDYIKGLE